jgi:hypothetical protein
MGKRTLQMQILDDVKKTPKFFLIKENCVGLFYSQGIDVPLRDVLYILDIYHIHIAY